MRLTKNYIKLIFGLKLKQLRQNQKLSLSELASRSDLSVSYLNEIESGKKYPKSDKIAALAEALNVTYDKLVSLKLTKNLTPIGDLLESNILEQLPLDHYGLDIHRLIVLMSHAPLQLSALVATLIEMAKSSEMSRSNFSRTALRTYKEFKDNYFDDLENAVEKFIKKYNIQIEAQINYETLSEILKTKFNYDIDESSLNKFKELREMRATVIKGRKNTILLNDKLSGSQKAFIIGKELAYNFLGIKERSYSYSNYKLETFDQLLNNYKASYFSTALILNKKLLLQDLKDFFNRTNWNQRSFFGLIKKYNASPEMFFQRIANLAPKFFNLNKFFFLRFNTNINSEDYHLSKELRLNIPQNPGGYHSNEHYCRRWVSIEALEKLKESFNKNSRSNIKISSVLRSKFHNSDNQFFCISVAKASRLVKGSLTSITLGFLLDENLKKKIKFWNDPQIPDRIVNDTCEKCTISDCDKRVAPPVSVEKDREEVQTEKALRKLKLDIERELINQYKKNYSAQLTKH